MKQEQNERNKKTIEEQIQGTERAYFITSRQIERTGGMEMRGGHCEREHT